MAAKRKNIVAGNWKMHKTYEEARRLCVDIVNKLGPSDTEVVLCPPFVHLKLVSTIINEIGNLRLGAQNCHHEEQGAFTGEVSAAMLRSVGVRYVILGHSERREYFGEDDALLAKKVDRALNTDLQPIFCCGEKLEVREAGKEKEHVAAQLEGSLFHLSKADFGRVVIAYEPVWAIGTGKTATPAQAQAMHKHIRGRIAKKYGKAVAEATTILYGGSCKPANAAELFKQPDVDGGLIGGASLKADDFVAIVNAV